MRLCLREPVQIEAGVDLGLAARQTRGVHAAAERRQWRRCFRRNRRKDFTGDRYGRNVGFAAASAVWPAAVAAASWLQGWARCLR